ncbi:MAG: hypothetical protein V4692_09850 [Bdellovibrionota bacterium]
MTFIFLLMFSYAAQATHGVSNGGSGLECVSRDGTISVDSWDISYGRTLGETYIAISQPNLRVEQLLRLVLARFRDVDPERFAVYSAWSMQARMVEGGALVNLTDPVFSGKVNCRIVPLAMQQIVTCATRVGDPSTSVLWVDSKRWQKLSTLDRAALLIHELVYKEAKLRNLFSTARSSENARTVASLVSYLMSDRFYQGGHARYWTKLNQLGFGSLDSNESTLCR